MLRARTGERLAAGSIALCCLAVLGLAAALKPASQGHGTHQQLGLPACTWAAWFGRPCPTCGMTTAFARAADADLLGALHTQPAGAFLAVLASVVFWGAAHTAITGSTVGRLAGVVLRGPYLWAAGLGLIGAWIYKMAVWQPA